MQICRGRPCVCPTTTKRPKTFRGGACSAHLQRITINTKEEGKENVKGCNPYGCVYIRIFTKQKNVKSRNADIFYVLFPYLKNNKKANARK